MPLLISAATIIDGAAREPLEGRSIWIDDGRIKAIRPDCEFGGTSQASVIDARGKYVVPGLMNANVHLTSGIHILGNHLRYMDRFEAIAAEAAQIALRNGLTTVFDTAGLRKPIMAIRDRINAGELPGSRIFCAGWIVGLDGILSLDFSARGAEVLSSDLVERINGAFVENVGPALTWMPPQQVAREVRTYLGTGIDFVKYASSEHRWGDPTTSLLFSPGAQEAIVAEAHRAGTTAQAHTSSVESLRVAVEAGCDLIQHCNVTGPVLIPETTIERMAVSKTGAVVFPFTEKRLDWIMENCPIDRNYFAASDTNTRNLLRSGAPILLANDGGIRGADLATDPRFSKFWFAPGEDDLSVLDQGHFVWFKAMEQKGMAPMEMLRAATRNIAVAYGKDKDLGTVEVGKIADLVILDKNPLLSAENYRGIHMIIKDGVVVDREALPTHPILTRPLDPPTPETLAYRAHRHLGASRLPCC